MTSLTCLNPNLRVIQYNGGPILGQYGVNSAFQVQPGSSARATATRAGTTFDIVLEYTNIDTNNTFSLSHLLVISPKFEEVTAMLKAGVVWVHDAASPYLNTINTTSPDTTTTTLDISYSQHFNSFHKDHIMPQNGSKVPTPCAVFNYGEEKAPLAIAAVDTSILSSIKSGSYIHIKFTETFDDDYNIDFGHFFLMASTDPLSPSKAIQTEFPTTSSYPNTLSLIDRSYLLQHKFLSAPSTLSSHNELLSHKNSESFFSQTSSVFISSKPIHQYLSYIEGVGDLGLLSEQEQEMVHAFIQYNHAAETFTQNWRKSFTSDLISTNLMKETGTNMIKGNKTSATNTADHKQLEYPAEIIFFTIDPTTPIDVRNVALGHVGELKNIGVIGDDADLELSNGQMFTILACSPSGACQKYEFQPKPHAYNVVCDVYTSEMAKSSLSEKITTFLTSLAISSIHGTTGLNMFLSRVSIVSAFLFEYYDQQEHEQSKKTALSPPTTVAVPKKAVSKGKTTGPKKEALYTLEQSNFFKKLLTQRILSHQSIESITAHGVHNHPIYTQVQLSSYHGLHTTLYNHMTNKDLSEPQSIFIMPVDKTTDSHAEIVASLFEFSNILLQFQQEKECTSSDGQKSIKKLSPLQIGIFDVLLNNVNDCLFSFSKFLSSARLFIVVPKGQITVDEVIEFKQSTTTTTQTPTNSTTSAKKSTGAKKAALGKVPAPIKKFTLPLINITSYIPAEYNTAEIINEVFAVDLIFDKMIDQSMVELAMQTEEEAPPPNAIELVNYIMKVQNFLKNALNLPASWALVPTAADKTPFAQDFGKSLATLNTLVDDISYLRLLHSTIVNSFYSRFIIQENKQTFEQFDGNISSYTALDSEKMNLVSFPQDSNEDKLMRALKGFSKRAEILLTRLPQPIGLCPIPFTSLATDNKDDLTRQIISLLPQEIEMDWDGDESKIIPQLMTLTSGIQNTKQFIAGFDKQSDLKAKDMISIHEKMILVRQGTDNTINLINDRVRVMIEIRDSLLQIGRYLGHFPQLVIDVCNKNSTMPELLTFFSYLQGVYYDTGLVYTLEQINMNNNATLTEINSSLKLATFTNVDTTVKPMMDFVNLYNPTAPTPSSKYKHGKYSITLSPAPSSSLNQSITKTAELFTTTISAAIETTLATTFAELKKSNNFVTLDNDEQFQRCLEGYILLEPAMTAKAPTSKSVFSRTAVNKAASTAKEANNNNKKWDDADDRIIVLWLTHNLDGTFNYLSELQQIAADLVIKYRSFIPNDATDQTPQIQNIVLARIDVEKYPDVLEQFALDPSSSLPALLFIQSCAERADLRTTAIEPKELTQLLTDGLVNMIENPELYGVGGLEDDDDEPLCDLDEDDDGPE